MNYAMLSNFPQKGLVCLEFLQLKLVTVFPMWIIGRSAGIYLAMGMFIKDTYKGINVVIASRLSLSYTSLFLQFVMRISYG